MKTLEENFNCYSFWKGIKGFGPNNVVEKRCEENRNTKYKLTGLSTIEVLMNKAHT